MFEVLRDSGALARLCRKLSKLFGVPQTRDYHPEIDTGIHRLPWWSTQSALRGFALPVRFSALTHDLGKAETPADILPRHLGHEERSVRLTEKLCARLRVPNDCRDLALLHGALPRQRASRRPDLKASTIVTLFQKTNALRRPERFRNLLEACSCDYTGRLGCGRPALTTVPSDC